MRLAEAAPWREPHRSRFVALPGEPERDAWLHFCLGHHVEFLYWQATTAACEQVTAAARRGEAEAGGRWMARVAWLVRGSGAMLHYCAAFAPELYDPCLRDSMAAARSDFSGDMSHEFLTMMRAKADMVAALEAGEHLGRQLQSFRAAERYWHHHHGEVILALHPGRSLLRETVERLQAAGDAFDYRAYVESVVRGEAALADYDDYFGVRRSDALTIDAYWTQAVEKLALAHSHLAMAGGHRADLMRGDATLLQVICERLDGEA